jgi:hypothetical protein
VRVEEILAYVLEHTSSTSSASPTTSASTPPTRRGPSPGAQPAGRGRDRREVSTRGGHLLALFIEDAIPPLRSLRESIGLVHEQGGLAIPAHPLFPYLMCAQARPCGACSPPPIRASGPDGGRPSTRRPSGGRSTAAWSPRGGARPRSATATPTRSRASGPADHVSGRTAEDVRAAILSTDRLAGSFHGTTSQLPTFGRQLRKYGRDARAEVLARVRRDGTGRDLGYPGGTRRPASLDEAALGVPRGEDQP